MQGGSGSVNVGCLTGEGEIFDNNYWTDFQIKPTRDCVFNGTMDAEVHAHIMPGSTGRFILGSANVIPEDGTVTGSRWLGFAPGVGKFTLGNFTCDSGYPLHLADTNGAPITAVVRLTSDNAKVFSADGPGSVQCNYYGVTFTGKQLQNTGKVLNNMWGAVTFGDGTAANDFDFSTLGGLAGLTSGSIFNINNAGATTIGGTLTGPSGSSVNFNAPSTTLKDIRTSGSALALKGDVTVDGGDAAVSGVSFGSADRTLTVNGGRLAAARAKPNANSDPVGNGPLAPTAFALSGSQAGSKVVVNGGDVWLKGATSVQTLEQNGGTVHFTNPTYEPMASATAANPCVVRFNGGRTYLDRRDTVYYNNFTPFSSSEALQLRVGAGGAEFVGYGVYSRTSRVDDYGADENWDVISRPLHSDVEEGVDGGVKQKGFMGFRYSYPLQITGTYEAEGGSTYLAASDDLSGKSYFGAGDMLLRNHRLELANRTESCVFRPHGAGKTLRVESTGMLHLRKNSSGAPVTVEMDALLIDRGALFLMDPVAFGAANASAVKLATAPETAANGRVYLPVVSTKDSASFTFVGYDAEKGFTNLTIAAASSFTNTDPTKLVRINSTWTDTGANKKLCAEALLLDNYTTLKLGDKTTVTIGDGVHPALLLMPSYGIDGEATASVEFGTSEGVIALGTCGAAMDCQSRLTVPIKSANGLTVVGWPSLNAVGTVGVRLSGTNTYSGDTRIGAAIVQAENDKCFSSGDVIVTGGQRYGGGVRFMKTGGVWANNFTIAGRGVLKSRWDGWGNHTGAMAFWRSGKVTGSVELTDEARLAATNGAFGEIAGVISGAGKAVLLHSTGVLRFSNANTYAGGTDLIGGSTLELAKGDSAGTGEILLSESTLRFVNDEPITFTNEVFGSGTIEIAGAPVTFTGRAFAALNGRALAKGTTIAFPTVDAAAVKYAAVLAGGVLDLGGEDMTFGQVWGSGTVSGGTATITGEIQPGGANAIGTLTFDRPPVFASGATFVCEDLDGACDKIVVEGGDAALDDLAFAFTLIGTGRGKDAATVLTTPDGAVSGEFSSVTKTPQKAERAEIEYGASKVDLQLSQGLLLLVR